ncbi:MAG: 50S ribosomal protein L30e [Euryarchaeota archaeon]|nr:50S ribosomal protein L30e [Euryarchaeota archaeon]
MDVNRALRTAVTTGKVQFGLDQTRKALKSGKARMVVLSKNCPEDIEAGKTKVLVFQGTNMELGAVCGKPFSVSALAILDPGESGILSE